MVAEASLGMNSLSIGVDGVSLASGVSFWTGDLGLSSCADDSPSGVAEDSPYGVAEESPSGIAEDSSSDETGDFPLKEEGDSDGGLLTTSSSSSSEIFFKLETDLDEPLEDTFIDLNSDV